MDPDVGLGIGREAGTGRPKRPPPSLFVRVMEWAGLVMVPWGIATWRFDLVVLGAALILGSYAIYRRKHGPWPGGPGGALDGMDGDSGGGD